jgi:cytoskeletal protein CcmA (bactofilin family)
MKAGNNKKARPGVALLVVLFIVMAITILSLGFVSRSDVELVCGQNMLMKTQIDYLAESGLEHARGLILNPQDVAGSGYWLGGANLQLTSGSDFYEVEVDRDASDLCNYIIDCSSYRLEGTEKIGLSRLHAVLRIDPCIAYWVGLNSIIPSQMTINGDVYCGGDLINNGDINGDVFASGTITGTSPEGQQKSVADAGVVWPDLAVNDYEPTYYIGSTSYSAQIVDANISSSSGRVFYSISDVNMLGNVTINGTLVVNGKLRISGTGNVITAEKNFPALLVTGQMIMEDSASLEINGLAQIGQEISIDTGTASIQVTGGLFIADSGVTSDKVSVVVTADPAIASIEIWPPPGGTPKRWSPAAGAFFRSITRPPAE